MLKEICGRRKRWTIS